MKTGEWLAALGAVGTICGIIFGFIGWQGSKRKYHNELKDEGQAAGELKADTEYIKRRIDDVLLEQKDTNKSIISLTERVARVEESAKSAHHRIDEMAKGRD